MLISVLDGMSCFFYKQLFVFVTTTDSVAAPQVSSIVAAQEYVAQRLATRKPTERLGEHVEQLPLFSKDSFMFLHSTCNTWASRGFSC